MSRQPFFKRFEARAKGATQSRIDNIKAMVSDMPGAADILDIVKNTGNQSAQLVLEIQADGIPLVRSYQAAVPVFGKTSDLAREISLRKGLGGDPKIQEKNKSV